MKIVAGFISVLVFSILRSHAGVADSGEDAPFNHVRAVWPAFPSSSAFAQPGTSDAWESDVTSAPATPRSYAPSAEGTGASLSSAAPVQITVSFGMTGQVVEGKSGRAILKFNYPPSKKVKFRIVMKPDNGQVSAPSTLTLGAGKTSCQFDFSVKDDTLLNLTRPVTFGLFVGKELVVANQCIILDNEKPPVVTLKLPAQLVEGKAQSTGSLSLDRPAAVNFQVALKSLSPGQLDQSVVSVRAGQKSATFKIGATDDDYIEGTTSARLAALVEGVSRGTAVTKIIDNEVKRIGLTLPAYVSEESPAEGTVTLSGKLVSDLVVKLQSDGADFLTTPATVTIKAGKSLARFPMTVLDHSASAERHTVGISASASGFPQVSATTEARETLAGGLTRTLPLKTNDLVWDATRERFYASVPASAGPPYANQVVAIDPVTMAVTAAVPADEEPGKLAMTSGGEALYVTRYQSGTILRIALQNFTIASSYAVGYDFYDGVLHAHDIATVAGKPDSLVILRKNKHYSSPNGVAVYQNGILQPTRTQFTSRCTCIEPSADPAVFFGFNNQDTGFDLARLELVPDGITEISDQGDLIGGFKTDIKTDGYTIFSSNGTVVDGQGMKLLGNMPTFGLPCPDLAQSRVYLLATDNADSKAGRKIIACDSVNYSPLGEMKLQKPVKHLGTFIRWGKFGFAIRTADGITLIENHSLLPSEPAINPWVTTDLAVTVEAGPLPATTGTPLTYSIKVSNLGPEIARDVILTPVISDGQTISSVAKDGQPMGSGLAGPIPMGNLAPGESKTLAIVVLPQSAGSLYCSASVYSQAVDPSLSNNSDDARLVAGFKTVSNGVVASRLAANNLVYDPTRGLLWASIRSRKEDALACSLIAINPITGRISEPIPIGASTFHRAMAISANGRYLYIGLMDAAAVLRIDLATAGYPSLRIPVTFNGNDGHVQDIEVLDGDGTSFICTEYGRRTAAVFDGATLRKNRVDYDVDQIEPSEIPGTYIGYNSSTSAFDLLRLDVTDSGVAKGLGYRNVITGFWVEIDGSAGLLLSSSGLLVNSNNLTLKKDLGMKGMPCLDGPKGRAYLVTSSAIHAFDTLSGNALGSMTFPPAPPWVPTPVALRPTLPFDPVDWLVLKPHCVRWGDDGLAFLDENGQIHIARWPLVNPSIASAPASAAVRSAASGAVQATASFAVQTAGTQMADLARKVSARMDSDADGISDDLEFLFGSSSSSFTAHPLRQTVVVENGRKVIRMNFPRRAGVKIPQYGYEISGDGIHWTALDGVVETVVSTHATDGVLIENMEAAIRVPSAEEGSVRLRWNP